MKSISEITVISISNTGKVIFREMTALKKTTVINSSQKILHTKLMKKVST